MERRRVPLIFSTLAFGQVRIGKFIRSTNPPFYYYSIFEGRRKKRILLLVKNFVSPFRGIFESRKLGYGVGFSYARPREKCF